MNSLKLTTIAVALVFVSIVAPSAAAQQNSRSGAVRVENADSTITAKKAVSLSGRVSEDGKTLISEDKERWAVSNPSVLTPHAGRSVMVKCQVSSDQNSIHVLSVKPAETKYVATHNDAAFRR
jgi:hypothetical protein